MTDRITVIGNIATEPEQRRTGGGVPVTSFRLASSQRYRDPQSGEWVEGTTNWYRVSVFRVLGENAFASLRKGQRVIVEGRLRLREWESNGKRGMEAEVDADAIGHDLKWGTAVFQRAASAEGVAQPQPAPIEPADEWAAAPGAAPEAIGAASREQAEPQPTPF